MLISESNDLLEHLLFKQNEEISRKSANLLTEDLTQTKHELLKVKEMLEMTEKVGDVYCLTVVVP